MVTARPRALFAAAALALAQLLALLGTASAHGYLARPASRNYMHWSNWCPQCLPGGGPYAVSGEGSLTWPAGVHGLCGDPYKGPRDHEAGGPFATGDVGGVFEEGTVMPIDVVVTAHHKGRFQFRICRVAAPPPEQGWVDAERQQLSEECLYQHQLTQANVVAPHQEPYSAYWYVPHGSWGSENFGPNTTYTMHYQLPTGLTCDGVTARCVMQWHWLSGAPLLAAVTCWLGLGATSRLEPGGPGAARIVVGERGPPSER